MKVVRRISVKPASLEVSCRQASTECRKGLVLGAYQDCCGELSLTPTGCKVNECVNGKLLETLKGVKLKPGRSHVVNNIGHPEFPTIAVADLGREDAGFNVCENLNECKENIRVSAGVGAAALQKLGIKEIYVEPFTNVESAAEGSSLAVWNYQDFKKKENRITESCVEVYEGDKCCWEQGLKKAEGQNIARRLEEMPANVLTPKSFSQEIIDTLCPLGINVQIKEYDWIKTNARMTAFARIGQNSCNKPLFVQITYCGGAAEEKPLILVGKGVTFDSGGLCLRKCKKMMNYKADMAGAAVAVGALATLAKLAVPINVIALLPLTENMPGMQATKPGDVVLGVSEKTIKIDNPRHEGRVVLADVLSYSVCFNPCVIFNVATLTEGVKAALGPSASVVFTNNENLWCEVNKAGAETGDRVWRFPLWKFFRSFVNQNDDVDVNNIGRMPGGDPCIGAAFLLEFIPTVTFLHMDITNTGMVSSVGFPYLRKGAMTGRPVRTLVQTLEQIACPDKEPSECGKDKK